MIENLFLLLLFICALLLLMLASLGLVRLALHIQHLYTVWRARRNRNRRSWSL